MAGGNEAAGSSATPPVQRLAISVEQKAEKPRFAPLAAAAAAGPCGPVVLVGLVCLFLFTTLGASGVAGVFFSRFLGIEDQVAKLEEENVKLAESNDRFERLNGELEKQIGNLTEQNEVFATNNKVFETQLDEQKEINKNLTMAYEQLQDEVNKLEMVATYLNETAIENNAKFGDLLDELSSAINSSRSTHDKQLAGAYDDIVKRVDCVVASIFEPFDFWQQGTSMGANYPDIFKQTNKVLGDICHDPSDLQSYLETDSLARWGGGVKTPADLKIGQYLSEIQRYGTALVAYYFDTEVSGIEWYKYDHQCDQLPANKQFVWTLHKRKGLSYIDDIAPTST